MAIQNDEPKNADRARRGNETLAVFQAQPAQNADAAAVAIRSYIREHDETLETHFKDLISDLRHLADIDRLPWASVRQGYFYEEHPLYGFMQSLNSLADRENLDWDAIMDSADMNHDEEALEDPDSAWGH